MEGPTMVEKPNKHVFVNASGYPQPAVSLLCSAAAHSEANLKEDCSQKLLNETLDISYSAHGLERALCESTRTVSRIQNILLEVQCKKSSLKRHTLILKTLETSTHLHQVNIPERSSLQTGGF